MTLSFVMALSLVGFGFLVYTDQRDEQKQAQLEEKIADFVPLEMYSATAVKGSYAPGESFGAIFDTERFTKAPSTLDRSWSCTVSGFHPVGQITIPGSAPEGRQEITVDPFITIPATAEGVCGLKFAQSFDLTIEGVNTTKVVNYEIENITIIGDQ